MRICAMLLILICAWAPLKSPESVRVTCNKVVEVAKPWVGQGLASYYGTEEDGLLGATTASGRVVTRTALIAAHRRLPFGTLLKVTCIQSRRSVVVEVADRGPFHRGRVLDLSHAAATHLGIRGVARVTYERLPERSRSANR